MTIDHLIVCLANDKQLETSTSILDYYIEKFTSCIITEHHSRGSPTAPAAAKSTI